MSEKSKTKKQQIIELYQKFDAFEIPEFPKRLLGYDRYEIDQYLKALVDAYERMYEQYQILEKEVAGYRESMDAIAKTLVDAKIIAGRIISETREREYPVIPGKMLEKQLPEEELKKKEPLVKAVDLPKELFVEEGRLKKESFVEAKSLSKEPFLKEEDVPKELPTEDTDIKKEFDRLLEQLKTGSGMQSW